MWSICRNSSTCVFNNGKHVKQASVQSDGSFSLSASVRDESRLWISDTILFVTDELIRQVAINCAERGLLLLRVRDELQMTLRAYQTLYESSVAFGMRKALMAEQGKSELERKVRSFAWQTFTDHLVPAVLSSWFNWKRINEILNDNWEKPKPMLKPLRRNWTNNDKSKKENTWKRSISWRKPINNWR